MKIAQKIITLSLVTSLATVSALAQEHGMSKMGNMDSMQVECKDMMKEMKIPEEMKAMHEKMANGTLSAEEMKTMHEKMKESMKGHDMKKDHDMKDMDMSNCVVNAEAMHTSEADKQASAASSMLINAVGIVQIIDLKEKKITIDHEAIAAVNWPPMKMRFTFENAELLNNLKVGDKVNFEFVQEGAISMLKKIETTK